MRVTILDIASLLRRWLTIFGASDISTHSTIEGAAVASTLPNGQTVRITVEVV